VSEALRGALLGGLAATAATALGALPALALRGVSRRAEGLMLGFATMMILDNAFA
jgi:ZIP family zinc transporter